MRRGVAVEAQMRQRSSYDGRRRRERLARIAVVMVMMDDWKMAVAGWRSSKVLRCFEVLQVCELKGV